MLKQTGDIHTLNYQSAPLLSLMGWSGWYMGDGFVHAEGEKARVEFAIPETDQPLRGRMGKRKFPHNYSMAEGTSFRNHVNEYIGYVKIDSITPAGMDEVFDIEVNGPHNFVAEGLIVHNSEMVYHSIQEHLEKQGVIFLSIEDGLKKFPDLFREYFGTVIPPEDNKFAAFGAGAPRLIAHVVPRRSYAPTVTALRRRLSERLPRS